MKRSEFFAKRQDHWSAVLRAGDDPGASANTLAARDAVAADVAGVQWDPEEPELPKRLKCTSDGTEIRLVPADECYSPKIFASAYYPAARDVYNLYQSGELVEKSLLDGAWNDLSGRIAENARLREELRQSEARQSQRAIGVDILLEKTTARLEDVDAALQRLAREAGVPDEGPDEIVNAVLSLLNHRRRTLAYIAQVVADGRLP